MTGNHRVAVETAFVLLALVAMAGFWWRQHRVARAESARLDRAERALAATDERIRSLIQYHPHAVYSLDLAGRFEDVNPACERLTGFSEGDLRGMDSTMLSTPEDAAGAQATLEAIAGRRAGEFETTILTKEGATVELRVTGVPIVVDDEVAGMYGIAEDVTVAHRMQRDLEAARAEAEQGNEAKSLFLANMSHELRTPLTSVLAAAEMLRDTEPTAEQERLLDYIDRPGEQLLRLVEDLLDFSELEAGRTCLEVERFDLTSMVLEVAGPARADAERKGLVFDCVLEAGTPPELTCDRDRVAQVLVHLLENAVKFTDSGSVRLAVSGHAASGRDWARFTLTDTGIGMTEEQLGRLFESFNQADASITRRFGGTGLGLAICRELVTLMGGHIEVVSTQGVGSTFSLLLPDEPPGTS